MRQRCGHGLFLVLCLLLSAAGRAEVSYEQLMASAQAGLALRDRGASLSQVLAETETAEMRQRFTPEDLAMIRRTVQLTFTSEVRMYELAETCNERKAAESRR